MTCLQAVEGGLLYSGAADGVIKCCDVGSAEGAGGEPLRAYKGHSAPISCLQARAPPVLLLSVLLPVLLVRYVSGDQHSFTGLAPLRSAPLCPCVSH